LILKHIFFLLHVAFAKASCTGRMDNSSCAGKPITTYIFSFSGEKFNLDCHVRILRSHKRSSASKDEQGLERPKMPCSCTFSWPSGNLLLNLGVVYTWGRIEGWPKLPKFEPIGSLHFSKSGLRCLCLGPLELHLILRVALGGMVLGPKHPAPKEQSGQDFW
jgi:hypothetical protein